MSTLDVDFVRNCFPSFTHPIGAKTAFLENASGSYMVGHVLDKLMQYSSLRVQPYGFSQILNDAGEQMDAGRNTMAEMLGMPSDNIYLGPSTTQNINTLAWSAASIVKSDSEIIVSRQEHEANVGAWERLCQRTGAHLKIWEIEESTDLSLDRLGSMLNPNVRILCVTHSSNILGTINPIEEIGKMCRDNGTRLVVDGVSFAPHDWPDLPNIYVDAYCFSTYKTYATHLGVMYVATDFINELDPQCHYFLTDQQQKRLDSAGPDHASIAALAGLGDYIQESYAHHFDASDESLHAKTLRVYKLMNEHELSLCQILLDGIRELPIKIVGRNTLEGREANLSLLSEKYSSEQLSKALAKRDIAASYGHFYAARLLRKLGIDLDTGILRISLSHYNSEDDILRLLAELRQLH